MAEITWKKLLCPVDLSEESRAALRAASDLSRRFGAELVLLHVEDGSAGTALLAEWKAAAEKAGAVRVTVAEAKGDPKSAIAQHADANGFDLVVMGTHGRTGRAHSLVGSVAENTVRSARTPVLVVHPEFGA